MRSFWLVGVGSLLLASSAWAADPASLTVDQLTGGAHARVVWMQAKTEHSRGFAGTNFVLGAFDSKDGKGPRVVLDKPANYFRPQLTGDGQRIVYSSLPDNTIHVVNFDGTNDREVIKGGYAIEVWYDQGAKADYVFMQKQRTGVTGLPYERGAVVKFPLDNPAKEELAWDQTPVTWNHFQLSADGKHVAIEARNPTCLLAELPNGKSTMFGRGCYPAMAPDNSYVAWHMDGMHKSFFFTRMGTDDTWHVPVNTAPGFKGRKIHQPHWSNHVRFVALTGPHPDGSVPDEGEEVVEVWLGRFAEDFTKIEAWAKVSENKVPDMYPDAWIEGGEKATIDVRKLPKSATGNVAAIGPQWPGTTDGLVYAWDNAKATNEVPAAEGRKRQCAAEPRGSALFGPGMTMDLSGQFAAAEEDEAALLAAIKKSQAFTIELVYTPVASATGRLQDGSLLTLGKAGEPPNVALLISRGILSLYYTNRTGMRRNGRLGDWDNLGKLEPGKAHHILVTATNGAMYAYVDGQRAFANGEFRCDYGTWQEGTLTFGGSTPAECPGGTLECVGIFDRYLVGAEARRKAAVVENRLQEASARKMPERLVVEATLARTIRATPVASLGTYKRSLAVFDYTIDKVVQGAYDQKTIRVAHWAVLDRAPAKGFAQRKVGDKVMLTLEKFDQRPMLGQDFRDDGGGASDLPLYLDRTGDLPAKGASSAGDVERVRDAVASGDLDDLEAALKADPKLANATAEFRGKKMTLIELSAQRTVIWRRGQVAVSELLVSKGAACDVFVAARAGLVGQVRKLVEADRKLLEARDKEGFTALQRALLTYGPCPECEAVADYLIKAGAPLDVLSAARLGMKDQVARLLEKDASLAKAAAPDGSAVLHWAVRAVRNTENVPAIVKLLIDKGADVAAKDPTEDDMQPLHHAAGWGAAPAVIDALLAGKAELNAKSGGRTQWTPLDYAMDWAGNRETIVYLKKLGAQESGNRHGR